jgi:Pro-kumamolisin, activation domain
MSFHLRRQRVHNHRRALTAGTAVLVLATVCASAAATRAAAAPSPSVRLNGVIPAAVSAGTARILGPVDAKRMMSLTLVLRAPRQQELQRIAGEVTNPRSPQFRHFLTFAQWKQRFAPSDAQVAAVDRAARADGLSIVHAFADNLGIEVAGSVGTVQRAFGITLERYRLGSESFFSSDRDPALPGALAGIVQDVQGLSSFVNVEAAGGSSPGGAEAQPSYHAGRFLSQTTTNVVGSGSARDVPGRAQARDAAGRQPRICCGSPAGAGVLDLQDLYSSQAYDFAGLQRFSPCCNPAHLPGGSPRESSIAIIGRDKPDVNDLLTFARTYRLAMKVTQDQINGPPCCDEEMTTDIETATAMANSFGSSADTAHIYAYEGGSKSLSDLLDAWEAAHSANQARVASTSFGAAESASGLHISDFSPIINAMTAEGWTIAAASGDNGAYDDCHDPSAPAVHFPASNPNVVAVGGTTLTLTNAGGFLSETAWSGIGCAASGHNGGGGGGGCSAVEPAGFWQAIVPSMPCGDRRAVPDLALNSKTPVAIYWLGRWNAVGGTSVAAPVFAGFMARVNAYLLSLGNVCGPTFGAPCAPLGGPNELLWLAGNARATESGRDPFYDITSGCNAGSGGQGYCAAPGYDLATGWGSLNALQLAWGLMEVPSHGAPGTIAFSGATPRQWYNADRPIAFSITSQSRASTGYAGYTAQWDAPVPDVMSHATPGSGDSFYDGPRTQGTTGTLRLAAAGTGCHTAHVRSWDNVGFTSNDEPFGPICIDNKPPAIQCAAPDSVWHFANVSVHCTAADQPGLSGLLKPSDASFTLTTHVAPGSVSTTALTTARRVCDVARNCRTAVVGPFKVDLRTPALTDWTAVSANAATGAVLGTPVTLSGTHVWGPPTSVLDGSWPYFGGPDYTPALPDSDVIQIAGAPGAQYTISFGAPTTNPVLELGSIGSRLDFPAGTSVVRLSGDSGFSVSGASVSGTPSSVIGPDGTNDANGTVQLVGTFTSITFTATPLYTGPEDGILVQLVLAAPVFSDWTAIAGNTATGSALGTSVTLSGTHVFGTPTSVLDGSWPDFAGPDYTPTLPKSDVIQIGGTPGASYTISFGGPTTDPILDLGSLACRLDFPAATGVVRLSGDSGFTVSGSSVSGAFNESIGPDGTNDANGTVKLSGTFTSITFTTTPLYTGSEDGILVQMGATPAH